MKVKLMICRFPGGYSENPDVTDWLVQTVCLMKADERIDDEIINFRRTDTPITMTRNLAIEEAVKREVDFVVMVDNDMKPDAYHESNSNAISFDPNAKLFWQSSFDFAYQMKKQGMPCCIAAPYCGPPPVENVYVFEWANRESDTADEGEVRLEQFTRESTRHLCGIQEVAALPTGLILIDMEGIKRLTPPYFYYEYGTEYETNKASTEDVAFTRDLSMVGVKQYCNWDAWAGHWKMKCVGRPLLFDTARLRSSFTEYVIRQHEKNGKQEERIRGIWDGSKLRGGQVVKESVAANGR